MLESDLKLADTLVQLHRDPLGFVMFAFPWDEDPQLHVVPLAEPWRSRYQCEWGPDKWTCEYLEWLGEQIREHAFDGRTPAPPIQRALASGHGIGKSALTGMLVTYLMSCWPHSRGIVTANTYLQLRTKTWAEICKWLSRSITAHWFVINFAGMNAYHRDHEESWRVDCQSCREENSESFAGLHAATSAPYYIFDEASAIPTKIWEVARGGLTDGQPMWFVYGNPTRSDMEFRRCFTTERHRWSPLNIDSRSCHLPNKELLQQYIDDYGEDSDFVRVRVLGEFPRVSALQLIPTDVVMAARKAQAIPEKRFPLIMGVDIARGGGDETVICFRRGRDARSIPWIIMDTRDTTQVASRIAQELAHWRTKGQPASHIFIDGVGVGGGVVDMVRSLGFDVIEVNAGAKPRNNDFENAGSEMWVAMRDWLMAGGAIPDDNQLDEQLTSREFGYSKLQRLMLEPKEKMKKRGLSSPDRADALAMTFAHPVAPTIEVKDELGRVIGGSGGMETEFDPYTERRA